MNRGFWFIAGAGAGIYAMTKARRAAEAFTPDGLRDRLAALSLGMHLLGDEVRTEMAARETELRHRLGLDDPPAVEAGRHRAELPPAHDRQGQEQVGNAAGHTQRELSREGTH